MTKQEIQNIKGKLRKGDLKLIEASSGMSYQTVVRVFLGERSNDNVLNAAIELLENRAEKTKKLSRRATNAISSL